jgi:hypothetical protein
MERFNSPISHTERWGFFIYTVDVQTDNHGGPAFQEMGVSDDRNQVSKA